MPWCSFHSSTWPCSSRAWVLFLLALPLSGQPVKLLNSLTGLSPRAVQPVGIRYRVPSPVLVAGFLPNVPFGLELGDGGVFEQFTVLFAFCFYSCLAWVVGCSPF